MASSSKNMASSSIGIDERSSSPLDLDALAREAQPTGLVKVHRRVTIASHIFENTLIRLLLIPSGFHFEDLHRGVCGEEQDAGEPQTASTKRSLLLVVREGEHIIVALDGVRASCEEGLGVGNYFEVPPMCHYVIHNTGKSSAQIIMRTRI
ncbi:unnamed protein product [Amoebophrya sp. A25]|nr:unnamed protein product [Amoebophrya sp. A25]|eukprot:GSA25T00019378001.1